MRSILVISIVAGVAASGCATKKFVSREVGEINAKVDTLSTEVEKTQERTKRNEVRIDQVDKDARSGIAEVKGHADKAFGHADKALAKAVDAERAAKGKLIYTVTLSNDKVTFPLNRAQVSDEAKKMIDEAVSPILTENKGVFFEIEGHTDSSGEKPYNQKLGEDRATAVRNYLHDLHNIALNRIEVISYGEEKPVVDNKTRDNRAQNRRVVIKVLE